MFETWLRTVLGLSTRTAASSALLRPAAMRSSTSCSRAVSCGNTTSVPRGRAAAKNSMIRAATDGPKIASPPATAATARTISTWSAPLSR